MAQRIVVGLMSGISMDGIDAAVVEIEKIGAKRAMKPRAGEELFGSEASKVMRMEDRGSRSSILNF